MLEFTRVWRSMFGVSGVVVPDVLVCGKVHSIVKRGLVVWHSGGLSLLSFDHTSGLAANCILVSKLLSRIKLNLTKMAKVSPWLAAGPLLFACWRRWSDQAIDHISDGPQTVRGRGKRAFTYLPSSRCYCTVMQSRDGWSWFLQSLIALFSSKPCPRTQTLQIIRSFSLSKILHSLHKWLYLRHSSTMAALLLSQRRGELWVATRVAMMLMVVQAIARMLVVVRTTLHFALLQTTSWRHAHESWVRQERNISICTRF